MQNEETVMWERCGDLVYCKDCEYFELNYYYEEGDFEDNQGRCGVISYIMDGYYAGVDKRSFNDFCSRGRPKRIST